LSPALSMVGGGGGGALPDGPWLTQNFGWVGFNAFGPTNNWPVCSHMIGDLYNVVNKLSGRLYFRLKCTELAFCWSAAPDPMGAYSAPHIPTCIYECKGTTYKRREGKGRRGEGKVKGRKGERCWQGFGPPKNFGMAHPNPRPYATYFRNS